MVIQEFTQFYPQEKTSVWISFTSQLICVKVPPKVFASMLGERQSSTRQLTRFLRIVDKNVLFERVVVHFFIDKIDGKSL